MKEIYYINILVFWPLRSLIYHNYMQNNILQILTNVSILLIRPHQNRHAAFEMIL
jgi:hypothetical protein